MAPHPGRKLFVNLPVADLQRSIDFFTGIGFSFDPNFTDEKATCMLVGEDAYVMLLEHDRFTDFTTKPTADASLQTEALLSFSANSREEVDRLTTRALSSGGSPAKEPMDMGFMYGTSFQDPDGHHWEVMWMDPAAAEQGPPAEHEQQGEQQRSRVTS
ncbi:MAG: glyoxalase family protein [Thermoleophilia bacterium]|nr:glyoxalase family protein [Thermoleophilia bacterium]